MFYDEKSKLIDELSKRLGSVTIDFLDELSDQYSSQKLAAVIHVATQLYLFNNFELLVHLCKKELKITLIENNRKSINLFLDSLKEKIENEKH